MADELPRRSRGRGAVRLFLLLVVPVAAALAGLYWYATGGRYVTTENAYIKAEMIAIAPNLPGRVVRVPVADNQAVAAGDVLFELDPEPYHIQLSLAEARMLAVRNEIQATRAEYGQIAAEIDEALERQKFLKRQAERQRTLDQRGVAAAVRLDEAENELRVSEQAVRTLRQKMRVVAADLGGDPATAIERHPRYLEAEAERDRARLLLGYTTVRAPADGIVSRMQLQPGEWVEDGKPVFSIIRDAGHWIEANLKETQLTHVVVGQAVTVEVDAYPDVQWRGRVDSISAATGAEFSILPPQNATGNWVKVVQRLPVRIAVEPADDRPPLRTGMTVSVSIDTGREREILTTVRGAFGSARDG
jgi:membrane fusion protein (multidrug efflux system)